MTGTMLHHYGLYFTESHVNTAKRHVRRKPFKSAWALLRGEMPSPLTLTPPEVTLIDGLRWRFDGDAQTGEAAVRGLKTLIAQTGLAVDQDTPYLEAVMMTLVLAQTHELLRAHPAYRPADQVQWRDLYFDRVTTLNAINPDELLHVEHIWRALMNLTAGIVLERQPIINDAALLFREVVDSSIRPQGYIPQAVEGEGSAADKNVGSLLRMLLSVKGLVLMAEAAKHIELDLWGYSNRGVSVVTAGLYPLYYYFYPEKWQWEADITLEDARAWFQAHGSYLELLNLHIRRPTRAIDLILKDIRPVFDATGGGLTTLSHGIAQGWGLFG